MFLTRLKSLFYLSALRQSLLLLALFLAISVIAWGGTYWLIKHEMQRVVDDRLSSRMDASLQSLELGRPLPTPDVGETARLSEETGSEGFWTDPQEGAETRYLRRKSPWGTVVLGENTERQEELRDLVAAGMQVSLLASIVLSGLMGIWMAQRAQRRLDRITAGLADIARGRLDRRITLDGNDDLKLLAGRINTTTAWLEQAMQDMRLQSSNIAHDLRTPLARLRAQLETSLHALTGSGHAVTEEDLSAALNQIDQIAGTFEALLRLSSIESGAGRSSFQPVDLGELVEQVAETFGPVVEEAGQRFQVALDTPFSVLGDQDMLMQLLANLIQNALRYGPDHQTITVNCRETMISVSDQGPGIPFSDRDRVLQPLYQSGTARQGEGFGLGLSLVRAIAQLHNADLTLADGPNGRGLKATVRFPTAHE